MSGGGVAVKRRKLAPGEFGRRVRQCSRPLMLVLWFAGRGGEGIQRLTVKEAGWDETGGEVCRAVGGLAPSQQGVDWQSRRSNIMGLWPVHAPQRLWAVCRLWPWQARGARLHKVLMKWRRNGS